MGISLLIYPMTRVTTTLLVEKHTAVNFKNIFFQCLKSTRLSKLEQSQPKLFEWLDIN